ncbi:hypothetical protein PT974_05093 [Cladobotryum mycophilum]|uniref:Uncharacterized protein n=1 Tax=Cladobotryum mycophilum TaxID=491253 RepID=A0ABR0SR06_9HYPO
MACNPMTGSGALTNASPRRDCGYCDIAPVVTYSSLVVFRGLCLIDIKLGASNDIKFFEVFTG